MNGQELYWGVATSGATRATVNSLRDGELLVLHEWLEKLPDEDYPAMVRAAAELEMARRFMASTRAAGLRIKD